MLRRLTFIVLFLFSTNVSARVDALMINYCGKDLALIWQENKRQSGKDYVVLSVRNVLNKSVYVDGIVLKNNVKRLYIKCAGLDR